MEQSYVKDDVDAGESSYTIVAKTVEEVPVIGIRPVVDTLSALESD